MEITIIISYYKALDNLKLILMALNRQSNQNFEVILSEDDYNEDTVKFISDKKDSFRFSITHIRQAEDNGFRKNEMLNRAIVQSKTEKLVFLDGDCVPHRHFVKNYIHQLQKGYIYEGRSVLLGKRITELVKKKQSLKLLNFFYLIFTDSTKVKDGIYFPVLPLSYKSKGRGLIGRNWGVAKNALIEVNGFDMDYVHAGVGEDVDIEWRLQSNGLKNKSMKNKAIVYHLFHEKGYSEEMVKFNYGLLDKKKKENKIYCSNGLSTIENS